jgi:phage shock protein PspC (stress-responsive transcriptional regulator)
MTENVPGGAPTPPDGGSTASGRTQEPPPHDGPRVTADEVRDLARLRRTSWDRHVAGVAGGIARHLDIDPVIVRVAFVVLTFFGGAGLLVYVACWLVVPADDEPEAVIDLEPRTRTGVLIVVGVLAALATVGDLAGGDPFGGFWFPLPLIIIGLLAYALLSRRDRRRQARAGYVAPSPGHWVGAAPAPGRPAAYAGAPPGQGAGHLAPPQPAHHGPVPPGTPGIAWTPPPRPRDPRKRGPILFWFTLGLVAVGLGALGILDLAGVGVADAAYPALALGLIAVMLLVGAFFGRAGGLIALGLVAALVLAGATVTDQWDGEQLLRSPEFAASVDDDYWLNAGEVVIDLSQVQDVAGLAGRDIEIGAGLGRVEVVVPDGVDVHVDAEVGGPGDLSLFGEHESGINVNDEAFLDGGTNAPRLELDVFVGVGEIEVTR